MPRPPSYSNSFSDTRSSDNDEPPKSWTPPLWLLSGSDQKFAAAAKVLRGPLFRLPIKPPPTAVAQEIARICQATTRQQPFAAEEEQIRHYQMKLKEQRRKARDGQEQVQVLEQRKQEQLAETKRQCQENSQKVMQEMESQLRADLESRVQEKQQERKRALDLECQAMNQKFQEEQEAKRKKREEEAKKEKEEAETEPKEKEESEQLESDTLKDELGELKGQVDSLNEKKTEMIWLLKQVIKAEEKQKATKGDK